MIKRAAIVLSTLTLLPMAARAELPERRSPLADAPAIRHRLELRKTRFEIGPGVTSTVGQDFYHAILVGGKASFHLTDWLALGGMFAYNMTPTMKTSFNERLQGVLDNTSSTERAPTKQQALDGMNHIAWAAAVQGELIPFAGKYSLAGKMFANYDFYGFGGIGFINFAGDRPACTTPGNSCPFLGMKTGANFGIGMHTYFNDYVTMALEVRDILLRNNPAGRDVTGDKIANKEDLSWDSNYMVGLNFTFFLPATAHKSE